MCVHTSLLEFFGNILRIYPFPKVGITVFQFATAKAYEYQFYIFFKHWIGFYIFWTNDSATENTDVREFIGISQRDFAGLHTTH